MGGTKITERVDKAECCGFSYVESIALDEATPMTTSDFDVFYSDHKERTLQYACSLGAKYHDAEEITHDILLEVWRNGQRCALQTMVRQHIVKLQRHRSSEPTNSRGKVSIDEDQVVEVEDCICSIDCRDQLIVRMKYEGSSDAEIGRRLSMSRQGIGKRLQKLRKTFDYLR